MNILIVDDSKIIHKIVAGVVELAGYDSLHASDGEEAIEMLRKNPDDVSLVILDWNMPVMNGFDCLKEIKSDLELRDIPVMMLTTESEPGKLAMAIREGAARYCSKPFTPEGLATKILEYNLDADGLVTNLVSFNVGVEIGQLMGLTGILIAMAFWRRTASFHRHAYTANVLLMTCGFLLVGYQLTGYFVH